MTRTRQFYQQRFEQLLSRLNPEQAEAASQIEGPTMVLAGPGTGKTQLLAARIGEILTRTDAAPYNVLCLTFSDAGVRSMRQRLLDFIGPEAHRVNIYTFHSFCNRVIREHLHLFGSRRLEPLGELDRIDLLRKLLDDLPPENPLVRGRSDRYFFERHLKHLFRQMKTENWSPETVRRAASDYLADLPKRPEYQYKRRQGKYQAGDPKPGMIEEQTRKMELLTAAAELFPAYQESLARSARYDYDDMILWVLRAFREEEWLLQSYQERFLYLLVDEYQDTNGAQNELLSLLLDFWESPNVFVVGDDDQSIYEFQGARLHNMLDLYGRYAENMRLLVLKRNYRSVPAILKTASALIGRNELRLVNRLGAQVPRKELLAAHPDRQGLEVRPELVEYPNLRQEEADLLGRIEDLLAQGVPAEEIAVIYARHRQADGLMELLERKGIPFHTRRPANLLQEPVVQRLMDLLHYLWQELQQPYRGEPSLFFMLHADFWGLQSDDLAELSVYRAGRPGKSRPHWRQMLTDGDLLRRRNLRDPAALLRVGEQLAGWIADAANLSLPHLLERVINQSGLLAWALEHPHAAWWIQALSTLLDFAREEAGRHPRYGLRDWLTTLRRMEENFLPLALRNILEEGAGVQLLTAHGAKGLEFDHVFLLDATERFWEPSRRGNRQFTFPDTLTFSGESDELEARRRLFFVAMTRARTGLYISWSRKDEKGKALTPCRFVHELLEQEEVEARTKKGDALQMARLRLTEPEAVLPGLPPAEMLDRLLGDFRLSPSSLNRLLDCPLAFYYEHLLRVPVPPSNAALMGNAVHGALQRLLARPDRQVDDLLRYYEAEMERIRGMMDPVDWQHRLDRGKFFLPTYFEQKLAGHSVFSLAEYRVAEAEVAGVPVTGIVDRIDMLDDQTAALLDYKTGKFRTERARGPSEKLPHGGAYWRQLQFYFLLLEGQPVLKGRRLSHGTVSFVEADEKGKVHEHRVPFRHEDQQLMRALLVDTWRRIRAHQFTEGCSKARCSWCNFVKRNQQVESFVSEEQESLDDAS